MTLYIAQSRQRILLIVNIFKTSVARPKNREDNWYKKLEAVGNEMEMLRIFRQLESKKDRVLMLENLDLKKGSAAVLVREILLSISIRQYILRITLDQFPKLQYNSLVEAIAKGIEGRSNIEQLVEYTNRIVLLKRKHKLRKILKRLQLRKRKGGRT